MQCRMCLKTLYNIPADNCFILLVDFSNAFNSVDRSTLLREVRHRIPSITAWMEFCYGAQPILHLADCTILSCCGVQGGPIGPLGFALVLQPIVERIQCEVLGLLINAWYLDEGTLCGSPDDLAAALSIIEAEGPPRGLLLNRSKSLIVAPADSSVNQPLLSDIPVTSEGFSLLGSPPGVSSVLLDVCTSKNQESARWSPQIK